MSEPLMVMEGLVKAYGSASGPRAVDDVSLSIRPGQTLGIVGESGSGKSTLLRLVLRLVKPTAGRILLEGQDVWKARGGELGKIRQTMQAVFQDPASSFNPRQSIGTILSAPLEVHSIGNKASRRTLIAETLERVGLPASTVSRFPHQLSGGQRQRIAIARAVILKPRLLLADEPTSALDVSVQAQVLKLFAETKRDLGLTAIFVSHNLAVIRQVSDHVAVMRSGKLVEQGPTRAIFENPQTDYTKALLAAVPDPFRPFREDNGASAS